MDVKRNEAKRQFETELEGHMGVLQYRIESKAIVFTHTGVPPEIEGRGVASALTKAGLEYARAQRLRVIPLCSFVQEYLVRHSEYQDLIG